MSLEEAHLLTLRVLKQVMEEKLDQHNIQLAEVRAPVALQAVEPPGTHGHFVDRSRPKRDSGFWMTSH